MVVSVAGVGERSDNFGVCHWCAVGDVCWCSDSWSGVGNWSSNMSGYMSRLFVYNGVKSIDIVSGVFDNSLGAVSLDEGVASMNNISVTSFVLGFGVACERILNIIGVAVLRIGIVFGVDGFHNFGNWRSVGERSCGVMSRSRVCNWSCGIMSGSRVGDWLSGVRHFGDWCSDETCTCGCYEGNESEELQKKKILICKYWFLRTLNAIL